jgi:AcrR family transcriptional regulator
VIAVHRAVERLISGRIDIRVTVTNMNARPYEMRVRAKAAAATGERIMAVARVLLERHYYDDVTLDAVAADAGVTVQTVIRRFGSKEGLVQAIVDAAGPRIRSQRDEAPAGSVSGAIKNLVEHYEDVGSVILHFLRQEERVAPFAEVTRSGRSYHADWVERVFASWLELRSGVERARLRAQLVAACDLQTWNVLRRQEGLSRRQTELAMVQLVEGVLG